MQKIYLLGYSNGREPLLNQISILLNFKDFQRFENVLNDFINYLQRLRLKEILKEKWGKGIRIQVILIMGIIYITLFSKSYKFKYS